MVVKVSLIQITSSRFGLGLGQVPLGYELATTVNPRVTTTAAPATTNAPAVPTYATPLTATAITAPIRIKMMAIADLHSARKDPVLNRPVIRGPGVH